MADPDVCTLLLRLAGPLQSWGTSSRWGERDTGSEPSKSGVVGLIAAALGRDRAQPVDDLARLVMGVRVDQEGVPGYDFQTAGGGTDHPGIAQAKDSAKQIKERLRRAQAGARNYTKGGSSISRRHYLQDAMFLVGLEGTDRGLLERIDAALRAPRYPIGLGRRGYVPSVPVPLPNSGVRDTDLKTALTSEPWPIAFLGFVHLATDESDSTRSGVPWVYRRVARESLDGDVLRLRAVIEATGSESDAIRQDQPIGAAFTTRVFGPRGVIFDSIALPTAQILKGATP